MIILQNYYNIKAVTLVSKVVMLHISKRSYPGPQNGVKGFRHVRNYRFSHNRHNSSCRNLYKRVKSHKSNSSSYHIDNKKKAFFSQQNYYQSRECNVKSNRDLCFSTQSTSSIMHENVKIRFSPLKTIRQNLTNISKKMLGSNENVPTLVNTTNTGIIVNYDPDNLTVTDLSLPFIPLPINNAATPNSLSSIPQEFIPIKESTTLKSDIAFKFKNPDGGEYETSITSSKVIEDLTRSQLTQEALNRHLIKKTQAPAIIIETEECGKIRVGNQNDDLILTKHGRAYFAPYQNKLSPNIVSKIYQSEFNLKDVDHLCIIALKADEKNTNIVQQSPHLIAAHDSAKDVLYAFGILTSTNDANCHTISQEQFKKFQLKKQGVNFTLEQENKPHNKKSQQLRFQTNIQIIPKSDIYNAKFDQEYFASLDRTTKEEIFTRFKCLQKSPYEIYTHHKVSDEILLQMCKDVDKEAGKAKPKHPLTSEEEKNKAALKDNQKQSNKKIYDKIIKLIK